jgi:Fe-S cluster assembly protein SufD
MEVTSLADALDAEPASLEPYLARLAGCERQPFVALNTAFIEDGAWVRVPDNSVIQSPIHLVFVSTGGEEATVCHPRNLIQVGENSQVAILESYWGLDRGAYFTNAVTEISAGRNAVVEHYKIEWESAGALHLETMQVQQSRQSQVTSYSVSLGGALVRNEIHDVLDGEGAECALFGLYLVDGQRLVDNHTRIEHRSPHTTSRELYKGALDGKGRAVFNGQIVVHPFASRIDAKQTNKNLLLSPEAAVNSKPQLEILNNDVKCTHGSTIGRLDEEALFYLRSRGIEREEARRLLTYAFASEIVRSMRLVSVREVLDRLVLMDLHGESRTGGMS